MKKILLIYLFNVLYMQPSFARGGCGHGGGHCGGHSCSHGGHVCSVNSHDTTNRLMNGVGWTYNGNLLIGKFLCHPINSNVFTYTPSSSSSKPQRIHAKNIEKIMIAGSDTLLSYRKDSTEYCHVGHEKYLSQKLTNGKIEVYERIYTQPQYIVVKYYGLIIQIGSMKKLDRMMRELLPGYKEACPLNKYKQVNTVLLFKAINNFNKQA